MLTRSERAGDKDRLGQLPRLAEASTRLAVAVDVLFEASATGEVMSLGQLWVAIEERVPRVKLASAAMTVTELTPKLGSAAALRAQLVDRYLTARSFLPLLSKVA